MLFFYMHIISRSEIIYGLGKKSYLWNFSIDDVAKYNGTKFLKYSIRKNGIALSNFIHTLWLTNLQI